MIVPYSKPHKSTLRSICSSPASAIFSIICACLFLQYSANAQLCNSPIQNDSFTVIPAVCNGTIAFLQGSKPTGGSGSFIYQWERSRGNCGNGNFDPIIGANDKDYLVPAGTSDDFCYRRTVISGVCISQSNATKIGDPTPPTAPKATVTQPVCTNNTGTIKVTTPAPGGDFTYSINGSNYNNSSGVFSNLSPGTYKLTSRYKNGCISPSNTITIESVPPISGTISPSSSTICPGGNQVLTVTGGTSYQWFRNGIALAGATTANYTATQAGTYTADIINGNCKGKASNAATITVREVPSGTITPAEATVCAGSSQLFTVTGGNSYQWYLNNTLINGATGSTFTATQAGTYTADIIRDGCKGKSGNGGVLTINQPPSGSVSPSSASFCKGGSVTITATGGSTYQWYRNGTAINGATSAKYVASEEGTYTTEIFSSNGCKGKASNGSVVTELAVPTGSISPSTVVLCSGGSATLTVSGGTSYQWYRDGVAISGATLPNYTVATPGKYTADIISGSCKGKSTNAATVTSGSAPTGSILPATGKLCGSDAGVKLSINGGSTYQWYKDNVAINGAMAATYTATQAGTYTVDIINGNCKGKASNSAVITAIPKPTGAITPAAASLCNGNKQVLTTSGGTAYQWMRDGIAIAGATNATYEALLPGTYSVEIFKDGCTGMATNKAIVSQSIAITFTAESKESLCASSSGSITINTVSGGSGSGYSYSKDNGATFQVSNTFAGLAAGSYNIVVKDAAGCKSSTIVIQVKQTASTLSLTATTTEILCGENTGSATVNVSGGVAPFQYSLDGGNPQTGKVFNGLTAGNHNVSVKDAAGCTADVSFSIKQQASTLAATTNVTNSTCEKSSGSVTVQATGGTPSYTYSLDGGAYQAANIFDNVSVGKHKLTVKDAKGCIHDTQFEIMQASATPKLQITNPGKICPGATASILSVDITAGSDTGLAYSYWTNAAATTILLNPGAVSAGTYYIKATNGAGCFTIKPVVVSLVNSPEGRITVTGPVAACAGESITLTASTGNTFQWYRNGVAIDNAVTKTYVATASGDYAVLINNGTCTTMAKDTITLRFQECAALPATDESKAVVPTAFTPNRNGANDVLRPILYNIKELRYFKVFNRWGQEIFQTREKGKGWDGTLKGLPQPTETYSWILECVDNNGNMIRQSGRSLLIR